MITTVFIRECPVLGTRQSYSTGGSVKVLPAQAGEASGKQVSTSLCKVFFSLCRAVIRAAKGQFASGHWLLQGVPRRVAAKLLKSELSSFISHQVIAIQFLEGNLFSPFFSMTWLYLNLPKFLPQLQLSVKFPCFFLPVFHFCLY